MIEPFRMLGPLLAVAAALHGVERISHSDITAPLLSDAGALDRLRVLSLGNTQVEGPGLAAIASLGNLRELHNAIAYACAVCEGGTIEIHDLPEAVLRATSAAAAASTSPGGEREEGAAETAAPLCAEAQLLLQYLRASRWNISAVAHQMGLSRMTVYRRMKRWGIEARR